MEKILPVYGFPIEALSVIMTLYKNTKSLVKFSDTSFFDIKTAVLQDDTFAPFLYFFIPLDYVLKTSLEKHRHLGFTLSPKHSNIPIKPKEASSVAIEFFQCNISTHRYKHNF